MSGDPIYTVLDLGENESPGEKDFNISITVPKTEVTPADAPTPEKPVTPSAPPTLKGWGRLRGGGGAAPPATQAPPKIESVPPAAVIEKVEKKLEISVKSDKDKSAGQAGHSAGQPSGPDYQHLNDRLNRIEQLISDLMVKVDDKTRSIEKSVAKVKAKSKHAKPQSVTICVDSPQGGASNDCDEQFL